MSFQFSIEDIKQTKMNEVIQKPYIIALFLLLLTPMFTYVIYHILCILKFILVDNMILIFLKWTIMFTIIFISLYTAIQISYDLAEISYNLTKKLYIMLGYNNIQLFDNIFYTIFFSLYTILFIIVLLLPADISLCVTLIYILFSC
jgi:hypothetical protein